MPPLATRGVGGTVVAESLPEALETAFAVVTRLGDPFVLMGVLGLLYVVAPVSGADRSRIACVVAVGLGALTLTFTLKSAAALPRPPGAVEEGFGFPSGHALGSTAVYGAAAALFPWGRRRFRIATAGVGVAAVSLSRVALGVHFLVDIVAGAAVGGALLAVALRIGPGVAPETVDPADADRMFDLAAILALGGLTAGVAGLGAGVTVDDAFGLGAAGGAWGAWRFGGRRVVDAVVDRTGTAVAAVGLLVILVGLSVLTDATPSPPAVAVGAGALVAGLLALPWLGAAASGRGAR